MKSLTQRRNAAKNQSQFTSGTSGTRMDRSRFRRRDFAQPPLEESPFAVIGHQLQRPLIALRRCLEGSTSAQKISAGSMEQVVPVERAARFEGINEPQRRL